MRIYCAGELVFIKEVKHYTSRIIYILYMWMGIYCTGYMYKMLQLQEHNYLVVIISRVFVIFLKAAILKMAHIT